MTTCEHGAACWCNGPHRHPPVSDDYRQRAARFLHVDPDKLVAVQWGRPRRERPVLARRLDLRRLRLTALSWCAVQLEDAAASLRRRTDSHVEPEPDLDAILDECERDLPPGYRIEYDGSPFTGAREALGPPRVLPPHYNPPASTYSRLFDPRRRG